MAQYNRLPWWDKNSKIRCECGNYGCIEALASGRAIALNAIKEFKENKNNLIHKLSEGKEELVNAELVARALRDGDEMARKIWYEAIDQIGATIASMINLISPELVLIGGGLAQSKDLIFDRIEEIVKKRAMLTSIRNVGIRPVTFGMQAATKGAASLILNEVLKLNYSQI